ncbi:hypothetical protein SAMN04488072_101116 [Lentibacillus halodurans]|uniref:Uncharacterized protein n=1 Tax=Lentibacillus halodurans TaxID=237679 RepID=A0A1I0V1X6_9BACI|nr:hypothetical protein [Lentibacillus halodurans]SFA70315.1 hypothetical protein SAMN04488072_101116 [Lentibacillus halodurans]
MEVILIILAIVAALSGFFKDNSDTDTRIPKRGNSQPGPVSPPSGGGNRNGGKSVDEPQSTVSTASLEEQQYEQRRQLAERMNTMEQKQTPEREHDVIMKHNTREPGTDLSVEQQKMKKRMNSNLTRTGLINGVIMSEVLGPPRAVKPYKSIVDQRKK